MLTYNKSKNRQLKTFLFVVTTVILNRGKGRYGNTLMAQHWRIVGIVGQQGVGVTTVARRWPNISPPTVILIRLDQRWSNTTQPTVILLLSVHCKPNATQATVIFILLSQRWPNTANGLFCVKNQDFMRKNVNLE